MPSPIHDRERGTAQGGTCCESSIQPPRARVGVPHQPSPSRATAQLPTGSPFTASKACSLTLPHSPETPSPPLSTPITTSSCTPDQPPSSRRLSTSSASTSSSVPSKHPWPEK